MILQAIVLLIFLGISCFHLADCWNDNNRRFRTKPLLMILLILFYLFSAKDFCIPLIVGLIFSFAGDVLLIRKGNNWLLLGGISFLGAHISYIVLFLKRLDPSSLLMPVAIVVPIIYGLAGLLVILTIRKSAPAPLTVGLYIYLLVNAAMNLFALLNLLSYRSTGSLLSFIGAIFFFLSDCILFLSIFTPEKIRFHPHFLVMSTYILAQLLITTGVLL